MFFDKISDVPKIATRTSCTIFAVPATTKLKLKNALYLTPDESKKTVTPIISIEQIREFLALTLNRETSDRFFVITPAETMNIATQNAFLKTFEEPHEFCHFILLTESPGQLLPTIRSRAQIFYPKTPRDLSASISAKPKVIELAKKLISATPSNLPALATEISKKSQPRQAAMDAASAAIEILYKSYFKTKNPKFLTKIPSFIKLHDHLAKNGHVKLHIVADLW